MVKLIHLLLIGLWLICSNSASAYVFERDRSSGEPVRLNVSAENPKVYFRIAGSPPEFENKDKFLDGKFSNLSDTDFFAQLVLETMKRWNDVEDSFVELALSAESGSGADSEDNINTIVFSSGTWSDAGSALPKQGNTDQDSRYIVDCDISLDAQKDPEKLAFTVLHELGHCLGLLHPHYSTKSVMSYSTINKNLELTLDDKAGVTILYPVRYEKRKNLIPLCGSLPALSSHRGTRSAVTWVIIAPLGIWALRALKRRKRRTPI
ncbi:MAG: Matrixin [Pseudomonadota bacterium]|jgi:hypothetical protein